MIERLKQWWKRRQELRELEWKMSRVTDPDQLRRLHDRYRNLKGEQR